MKNWWKESVFYEIYMPSFKDSNGDGTGDFRGIIEKLDYLENLGINGIWLTPFYPSPKVDNGYDVSDYCAIDTSYGTMKDFELFISEAHKRGIRVIADMVFNHTSTEHRWFKEAKKSKDNPYRNYYIWRDEPNNWESFFSGSAWEYDEATSQYYYHKFAKEQADLNWINPKVMEEAKKILKFWIDKGVDGFRFDVINFLSCEGITLDNPADNGKQLHKYDIDQKGILETLTEICSYVKTFGDKFLVGEIGSDKLEVLKRYQNQNILDVVFNFNLGSKPKFDSEAIFKELSTMSREMTGLPTLFFSSHDMSRHISRFGECQRDISRAKAIAALMMTAAGVPFIFQGDELGMTDLISNSIEDMKDIQGITNYQTALSLGKTREEALKIANQASRDKSRSPMQWDDSVNAGFTASKPWLRVNDNYKEVNAQNESGKRDSLLRSYISLIRLRKDEVVLSYGRYKEFKYKDGLLYFSRIADNEEIRVYISFDKNMQITLPSKSYKVLFGRDSGMLAKNEILILKLLEI